jgi:hypothetical protein
MPLDRGTLLAVAPYLLVMACGPAVRPEGPADDSVPPPVDKASGIRPIGPGRAVLVGEMCPEAAAGRPGIAPLFLRGVEWSDDPETIADPIERTSTSKFAVLGFDGKRAGVFEPVGAADAGLPQDVASGIYVGASPCTTESGKVGARTEDIACNKTMKGCGLAVAEADRAGEPPPVIEPGGACVAGDLLVVDVDADGTAEAFPLAGFLDGVRAPADEVSAAPIAAARCTPRFSVYGLTLAPGIEPGAAVDPKYQVGVDVLGVADLDGDGRREIALALHYPENRTVVLYSAVSSATRLEQVAESVSWP